MTNRHARVHAYYQDPNATQLMLSAKVAAAASQYKFRGPALSPSAVVRCDLNGYSAWARDKQISQRVELLDSFFSTVVPLLGQQCGVFFRDEGDCIVSVFSDYFQLGATTKHIEGFCKAVVSRNYGRDGLTAKAIVACGELAYFQKGHEAQTDDWSAEGQSFVTAARLEQAIPSGQRIAFLKDEYYRAFASTATVAARGSVYHWTLEEESIRVPGLGLVGGWTDIVRLEFVPGGRMQT